MKIKIILATLIVLGTFLRFYRLGDLPNSYTPDEIAQGYTAYSIIKTGHDEWGDHNFLSLRSFGDFKPSLQTLLMIPFVKVFGLTPFAIRLPNAVLSILLIPLTFVLAQKLLFNSSVSILATLLVTLSPITLPLSRLALEANLLVIINLIAVILFLTSHRYFSLLFFSLSLITYHSSKILFPLIFITLILFYKRSRRLVTLALIFYVTVSLLTSFNRTTDIAIFNPTDSWSSVSESRFQATKSGLPDSISRIFNNKVTYTFFLFAHNYLSYFSPQFLATSGAGETTYGMIPGQGILGIIPFLGLCLALVFLLRTKNKSLLFLFVIVLITPIAAALSKGSYSANRLSSISPYIQILAAYGLFQLFQLRHRWLSLLLVAFLSFEIGNFLVTYFFRANQILAPGMLYGHRQALEYLRQYSNSTIIYSRRLSEPQAYVSFFNQVDPFIVQQASTQWLNYQGKGLKFLDQLGEYHLQNYLFKEINFSSDSQIPNSILVGRPEEFPGVTPSKIIFYPDFNHLSPAIYIYHSQ